MKKVLLIGADGMLGGELRERLEKNYEVYGTTLATLDITDREAVLAKAKEVNPYFIINCAAYTNVDGCETNEDLALAVNGTALANIAEAAKQEDATLIHISTDYVFPLPVAPVMKMFRYSVIYSHVANLFMRSRLSFRPEV